MLRSAAIIGTWLVLYLGGGALYFALTGDLVKNAPALMIPLLMPLGALSAWVSWRIEKEIEPDYIEPRQGCGKTSILPLLCMSVFYSSIVEGFLYEWFLHGGLSPWLRIGIDLLWLSPFFTDAAATYVYMRLLGQNPRQATEHVSARLPSFIVPLLGFWSVFSIAGNVVSNPLLSFMIFDFGIIAWTVFFTWANRADLPEILRTSRFASLRRLGVLNAVLSRPLERVYRWRFFGSYLVDLVVLVFSLCIASELWLANVASATTLAALMAVTFATWKGYELWTESGVVRSSLGSPATDESRAVAPVLSRPAAISVERPIRTVEPSFVPEGAGRQVLKPNAAAPPPSFAAENPRPWV
jgi:hypothetical protein